MHVHVAAARARVLDDLAWPERPADEVNAVFDAALQRFVNARVWSFVPILVERAVREAYADSCGRAPHACPLDPVSPPR